LLRGPRAEIDLSALSHNLGHLKSLSGGLPAIAVVKADAYGHGATQISKKLVGEGVSRLGVAFLSEALLLRESGIRAEIIVFFDVEEPALFFEQKLTPVINSIKEARAFSRESVKRNKEIEIHVKVDTGMGRMGMNGGNPEKEILEIAALPGLKVRWLMSHFSDVSPGDPGYARLQLDKMNALRTALAQKGVKTLCHMSSSASTLLVPESHMDSLRVGLLLYGCIPFPDPEENRPSKKWDFRPVMKVKTNIRAIKKFKKGEAISYERSFITGRDSLIAVLPVGYADGYHRMMSNKAHVVINGKRAPQVGRICMDLTMIDVSDIEGVSEGDEVVLLGDGLGHLELASWAGTNPYEIMTSLGKGARRSYLV